MSKEIYISSTPHETRLAIVENEGLSEIYYERENEYTLAGSIYNGRVTRVLPGMQSSFVDIGLERDAFLYITDFMEEQGDSADFEGGGSREPRAAGSSEGRREGRSDRGERGGRRERSDRGERPRREARSPEAAETDEFTAAVADVPSAIERESGDVGEGAPGADGSRRWRGRRGRRRGGKSGDEGRTPLAADTTVSDDSFEAQPLPGDEHRAENAAREQLDGETESGSSQEPRHDREGRRGRRDRGDRNGGGDRGRSSGRDRSSSRTGESYGHDAPVELSASAEPFILPGESLSRYRKDGGAEAGSAAQASTPARPQPTILSRPSTEIDISAWDGGMTLPGETLRGRGASGREAAGRETASRETAGRERSTEQQAPHAPETVVSQREGGGHRRRDRDQRRGRHGSSESAAEPTTQSFAPVEQLDPAEAVLPGVTSQHEVEPSLLPFSDDVPVAEVEATEARQEIERFEAEIDVPYEPQTDLAPSTNAEHTAVVEEATEEFHEVVSEYEPGDDASASFRVDPAPPREFRQSTAVDDVEAGDPLVQEDYAAPSESDEFTHIQPTGEMISEFPLTPEAEANASLEAHVTAPIEHEAAVQSVPLAEAERTPEPVKAEAESAGSLAFEPGDGALEEELLDDEEGDPLSISAGAGFEDTEEETVEHDADLGVMLRDMSIDQITSGEPPLEEDDDDEDYDLEDMEEDELDSSAEFDDVETEESDSEEFAETRSFDEDEDEAGPHEEHESGTPVTESRSGQEAARPARERRDRGRRGGRDRGERTERGSDRSGERSGGDRERGGRHGSRPSGRMSRHVAQTSDLPAISDLLKPGQELLVQIAKEPIAKKGARITSHIALPGRFLVFMPTVNHVGVSRKIESDSERRRLKEILLSEKGEASGGFIVRTAASGASEEELRSDLRFLLNLWADIKSRSESSKSPALIYHDLNLVERVLRDQVTDNFSAIWVDTETEYERVLRFLQRFQPSLIRRVKLYTKDTPLFEQFGIAEEINKALRSKVWLKSGGSIVINQTEALVAIDINTGKYVGKTARLEDTIVKTNLDAIPEIVRQVRLRDLGGIIVIDFIDMDDRKNRHKVLAALEEELKKDRAPSKVLQFNDFGLVAITRKRVKQSLERTLSTTCSICAGTGMTKSPVTVCNEIYIELRKMHRNLDKGDIMLRVNPEVVKQLKSNNARWLQDLEELAGKTILVKSDPTLHPEQFDIH